MNADNLVILNGRLTRDVDLRQNQNGDSYGLFTVAVNRTYKDTNGERPADFHNCVANGKQAEVIAQYFKKGDMIGIVGELRDNNYMKDGVQQYGKQIKVDSFGFRNSNNQNSQNSGQSHFSNQNQGNFGQAGGYKSGMSQPRTSNLGENQNYDDPFESNEDVTDISDDDLPF